MTLVLLIVLVYVGAQLALGMWVSRRVSTQADYVLGGRSLGLVASAASMFATWFGAETCIGTAGEVYAHGLGAVSADPFGYGICLLAFGLFIAATLRKRGYTTLADLFGERFSRLVERTVALLLLPGSILWAAAQIRAFGQVFAAASNGLDPALGIALAALITIVYTGSGGLLADVYTDVLQGIVLVATLVALAAAILFQLGSFEQLLAQASSAGGSARDANALLTFNAWAVPIAGSLFTQEIISRAVASRTVRIARQAALVSGVCYLVIGSIPVLLGLIARALLPQTDDVEQVLPLLARQVLGELGFVVLAGALVSAILSTVDSALLAGGTLIIQNVVGEQVRTLSDAQRLRLTRLSVVGLGVLSFLIALLGHSVHSMVQESSALGSAGLFVAGLLGLFTRFGGARAALLSLLVGALTYVYAQHVLESDVAYLSSLGGAVAGYVLGALWETRPATVAPAG